MFNCGNDGWLHREFSHVWQHKLLVKESFDGVHWFYFLRFPEEPTYDGSRLLQNLEVYLLTAKDALSFIGIQHLRENASYQCIGFPHPKCPHLFRLGSAKVQVLSSMYVDTVSSEKLTKVSVTIVENVATTHLQD